MEKAKNIKVKRRFTKDDLQLSILAVPTTVWYLLFSYLPMFGIIIAFKDVKTKPGENFILSIFTSDWVGLKNFRFLFRNKDAWIIFRNTIGYNAIFIILGVVVPVALAIALNQVHSKRMAKTYQTALLLPYFMSWVVVAYFVSAFLDYDLGVINRLMKEINPAFKEINWYQKTSVWPYLLVMLNTWKLMGYNTIIYLATITGMDHSIYEAARIDGASKWQQIKGITLPLLKPIIIMMFILALGRIFYSDFGLFYQVPRQSPSLSNVTNTFDVYIYQAISNANSIGKPSAAMFIQSVAGCITILSANALVRKLDKDSALI